jgi:N-glycosylase/DNA lyase
MKLIQQINNINLETKTKINQRIKEFESFKNKNTNYWFSELCFCLLTANSKAQTAINIQKELNYKGFYNLTQKEISNTIKNNKHRFHNNKAKYIVEARKYNTIKEIIKKKKEKEARTWLVNNIKGLGYKEASHFLRNVGYKNLAILDRHILRSMKENKIIKKIPKTLNKTNYKEIESKLNSFCKKTNLSMAELDLYIWYLETNKILK